MISDSIPSACPFRYTKNEISRPRDNGGQSEQWYATTFNWFGNCGKCSKGNLWKVTVALPKAGFLISLTDLLGKMDKVKKWNGQ
jgi:hypothetical protein